MQERFIFDFFSLLHQYGVRDIVCSPGSRNAAFLAGITRFDELKTRVVVDERSAAFIALGIAVVSRKPVALVCTSGSAVLNYAPAVAEAFYQGVPLIVVSADRPEEWIDQDDSQTIRQAGVLDNFVKGSFNLDAERFEADYEWYANRLVNEGLTKALRPKCGPVHFNIHLSGFVERDMEEISSEYARKLSFIDPPQQLSPNDLRVWSDLMASHKVMIVAGFMPPDHKLQKAMAALEAKPNVCVMAETLSNLHLPPSCYMVDTVLFPLSDTMKKDLRPDILISLGGALVSRKLKEFLRKNPPRMFHLAFNYSDSFIDCFQSLSYKMECSPSSFLLAAAKKMEKLQSHNVDVPDYGLVWNRLREGMKRDFSSVPWSDLKALHMVLGALPEQTNLFLSNGTSVRYGQIIPYRLTHATYGNRGVSGIEGCASTAVGASMKYPGLTCLITGDMSFGYDTAGLASGLESPAMRIVVLDNGGGDIFRFIPATKSLPIREEFLCADREVPVGLLADAYGWIYFYADSEESLAETLDEFFDESVRPCILHIDTRAVKYNSEILTKYLNNELGKN